MASPEIFAKPVSPPTIMTLRNAVASDQRHLEALQWRASLNNPSDREALLANPDAIELPLAQIEAGGVFVAECAGIIKGFAAILPRDDGDAELDALFVEPAEWKRGIGRTLVEYCCSAARTGGATSMHVVGNPSAKGFYLSCGFIKLSERQMRFGVGLVMLRPL
jgi:N-acetylglutamate synthase-like GNAT family acetyltransferase